MRAAKKSPEKFDESIRADEALAYKHYGFTPTEQIISVDDGLERVAVRLVTFGEAGDKPPILLLHGIASVNVIAAPLLSYLHDRQVIAIDWPGHGLSGERVLPISTSLRKHAVGVIRSVLDTLEIREADLIGHSLGAQFGMYAALELGSRIRRLVVLGAPGAGFLGVRPIPIMKILAVPGVGRLVLSIPVSDKAFRRNNEKSLGTGALDQLPAEMLTAGKQMSERVSFAPSVASYFRRLIRRGSVRSGVAMSLDDLSALAQPTLLVWGDDDVFMKPQAATESLAKIKGHHLVRIPNSGHAPWLQDAGRVGSAIADHLQ